MAKISSKNIAEAVYKATVGKSGDALTETIKRSVKVLSDKRLLGKSKDILQVLQDMIDRKNNTIRIKVMTAKSLDNEAKKKLENEIKEKYKAEKVESEFFERPELLGGMRIEIGDEVLDTTYKNKLKKLEKFLIHKN